MENKKDEKKINWYDLRDLQYLYLEKNLLKKLINEGINKAGSLSMLCKRMGSTHFYTIMRKGGGISIKKLKKLLQYLNKDYNILNKKISEIKKGIRYSIRNPKFPIDLANEKTGSILGHLVSDGFLSYDRCRKDFIRTGYCSPDEQLINEFIFNINDIFGEVHFYETIVRTCKTVKTGSSTIGECFKFAGVPVGKKYKINDGVPWIVIAGNTKMKKNYLSAIFDDEGSVGSFRFPYLELSRNIHIALTTKEKKFLEKNIKPHMIKSKFPTGHTNHRIAIRKARNILNNLNSYIYNKIVKSKHKLLIEESKILESFGIKNRVYVRGLSKTNNGDYSISSSILVFRKQDLIKFYKNVGFKLPRKQEKLRNSLINCGWLPYGS